MATRYNYTGGIVTDGLVLHLDAAKRDSYPGSGTTWYDLSGNGNNGTLTNGPTFSGVAKNAAIQFDGSNDTIATSVSSDYMTIAAWIKSEDTSQIAGIFDGTGLGNLDMYHNAVGYYYLYTTNTDESRGAAILQSSTPVVQGTWYYLAVVFGSGYRQMYQNSTLVASDTKTSKPLTITNIGKVNTFQLDGSIALTSIYNRALSDSEIQQNYNALKGRFGL